MSPLSRRGRAWTAASWVALALLGLVVAAAVSLAASHLSSQHIGLSSEPVSAGQQVTPADDRPKAHHASPHPRPPHREAGRPAQTAPLTPQPVQPAPQPVQPVQPAPQPTHPAPSKPRTGDDSHEGGGSQGGDD